MSLFQPVCSRAVIAAAAAGEAFLLGERTSSSTTAQNKPSPIFPGHVLYTRTEIPAQRSPAPAQRGPSSSRREADYRRAGQTTNRQTYKLFSHPPPNCLLKKKKKPLGQQDQMGHVAGTGMSHLSKISSLNSESAALARVRHPGNPAWNCWAASPGWVQQEQSSLLWGRVSESSHNPESLRGERERQLNTSRKQKSGLKITEFELIPPRVWLQLSWWSLTLTM